MHATELDDVDKVLIGMLVRNSRTSASSLALVVGLTRQAVADRMFRLHHEGVIRHFTVALDGDKLGLETRALVSITLLPACSEASENSIIQLLRGNPWVRECYRVTGEDYFHVRVVAPNVIALKDLITELRGTGFVQGTRTLLALETNFEKTQVEAFSALSTIWNEENGDDDPGSLKENKEPG